MFKRLTIIFFVFKNIFLFKIRKVDFGDKMRIRGPIGLIIRDNSKLIIGHNFSLVSGLMQNPLGRNLKSMFRVDKEAKISIGDNVEMSCVSLWAKNSIRIGDNVKLGAGVIIMDSDMHSLDYKLRRNPLSDSENSKSKQIVICNDSFVGVNSIITKGVTIGERAIIAAGSVVVKSVPNDEIWGGNPAKFIKKLE